MMAIVMAALAIVLALLALVVASGAIVGARDARQQLAQVLLIAQAQEAATVAALNRLEELTRVRIEDVQAARARIEALRRKVEATIKLYDEDGAMGGRVQ